MFDPCTRRWVEQWCDEIAPGLKLPRVLEPWEEAGRINDRGTALTGLPEGIPVCAGTIDALAESASVGVKDPGDVMLTYGTTMGVAGVVTEPTSRWTLNSVPGVFPGTYILIGPTATSGALTNRLRTISGDKPFEELIAEALGTRPGANGLVALPYFADERTPIWDTDARGVIIGLTMSHTRGHLYRALLEATAYSARSILDAIGEAGVKMERIVAVGGGTKGGRWTQIVSDVTGLRQALAKETMGACYGDALFAARAAGLIDDGTVWASPVASVQPNPNNRKVYDRHPARLSKCHTNGRVALDEVVRAA